MFIGRKVVSKQVQNIIPAWLQNLLWYLIETMEVEEQDFIQFFELTGISENGELRQRIVHRQLIPFQQDEHIFSVSHAVTANIIVMDNELHCFMLLLI